jgi:hypothetical protein
LKISTGDSLLLNLITTDGVLLAFVGVVFAQLLSSTSDQQNILYQRILEINDTNKKKKLAEIVQSLERKRIVTIYKCNILAIQLPAFCKYNKNCDPIVYA